MAKQELGAQSGNLETRDFDIIDFMVGIAHANLP